MPETDDFVVLTAAQRRERVKALPLDTLARAYVGALEGIFTPLALTVLYERIDAFWRAPVNRGREKRITKVECEHEVLLVCRMVTWPEVEEAARG